MFMSTLEIIEVKRQNGTFHEVNGTFYLSSNENNIIFIGQLKTNSLFVDIYFAYHRFV